MKVPKLKFNSLHGIRCAVCTFQPRVSVRYRTKLVYLEATKLTGASRNTSKQLSRALIEHGHLYQRGSGRGA